MQKQQILPPKNNSQHFFRNNYGTFFEEFSYSIDNKSHFAKSYFCLTCGRLFLSKNGARNHICFKDVQINNSILLKNKHLAVMEHILRYIATSNTPFRSADNEDLRKAFNILDPSFVMPGNDKLRSDMLYFSDQLQKKNEKRDFCENCVFNV